MSDTIVIACPSCRVKNRVPITRIKEKPNCGKCGTRLSMEDLGKVVEVTDATFEQEVMRSELPVLVDCWAPWCGPCKSVAPVLEGLAEKYQTRVKIVKVNMDENTGVGSRFSIASVPTLLLVKGGRITQTLVGALPKEQIEEAIERII
jgi:thioredoxin 2